MNNNTPTCVDQEYESAVHGELLTFPVQELVIWSVRLTAPGWAQMWSSGHITGGGSSVDTRLNPDVVMRLHHREKGRGILWVPLGAFGEEAGGCTSRGNRNCGGCQGKRPMCVLQPFSHCWLPIDHRYFLEETSYFYIRTYRKVHSSINDSSINFHKGSTPG